jgi:Arc/MetJ-type ribon-helix-helix transcriptional regulator
MVSGCYEDGRLSVDSEKITINLGVVDLGKVDLLVEEGFYSNRTDFIRTAIRNQLDKHEGDMTATITRKSITVGVTHYGRKELEEYRDNRRKLAISVIGMLTISDDVSPDLAREAIESVKVHGVFRASSAVKDALADRSH